MGVLSTKTLDQQIKEAEAAQATASKTWLWGYRNAKILVHSPEQHEWFVGLSKRWWVTLHESEAKTRQLKALRLARQPRNPMVGAQ